MILKVVEITDRKRRARELTLICNTLRIGGGILMFVTKNFYPQYANNDSHYRDRTAGKTR